MEPETLLQRLLTKMLTAFAAVCALMAAAGGGL